jgi:hypothetical protein
MSITASGVVSGQQRTRLVNQSVHVSSPLPYSKP